MPLHCVFLYASFTCRFIVFWTALCGALICEWFNAQVLCFETLSCLSTVQALIQILFHWMHWLFLCTVCFNELIIRYCLPIHVLQMGPSLGAVSYFSFIYLFINFIPSFCFNARETLTKHLQMQAMCCLCFTTSMRARWDNLAPWQDTTFSHVLSLKKREVHQGAKRFETWGVSLKAKELASRTGGALL